MTRLDTSSELLGVEEDPQMIEERLKALGDQVPPPSEEEVHAIVHRRAKRVVRGGETLLLLIVLITAMAVQWARPVPAPSFKLAVPTSVVLPGAPMQLPWPVGGSAALAVEDGPFLGSSGSVAPTSIAGLAKVMTAYVVLHDHPLTLKADGPIIPVNSDAVRAYKAESDGVQAVPVTIGEKLTERQALQGLLVASGNDMAVLLAEWDAGSMGAFVNKMNAESQALGLRSTTFKDPIGLDAGTKSTPRDLIHLAETVMAMQTFKDMVALGEVSLPGVGLIYNLDALIGHGGFIGIKTGADSEAGGNYVFAARRTVAGKNVTLFGAVLDQHSATPLASALTDAAALVRVAFSQARVFPILRTGQVVGQITAPWSSSPVAVTATSGVTIIGWPGKRVTLSNRMRPLQQAFHTGTHIGALRVDGLNLGATPPVVQIETTRPMTGPSKLWRLKRH